MPRLTPSGKKTKLASFEDKVSASSLPGGESEKYAIANKVGLMHGNKATARGKMAAASEKKPARPGTRFGPKKTRHYTGR